MAYTKNYTTAEPSRDEVDQLAGPVILEFGAPWWGYCLETEPQLAALLADHHEVRHIKIYDGRGKPLGRSFRVKLWPSLIFMRDGKLLHQVARPSESEIERGLSLITAPPH